MSKLDELIRDYNDLSILHDKIKFKDLPIHRKISLVLIFLAIFLIIHGIIALLKETSFRINEIQNLKLENSKSIIIGYLIILIIAIFNMIYENIPTVKRKIYQDIYRPYQEKKLSADNAVYDILRKYNVENNLTILLILKMRFHEELELIESIYDKILDYVTIIISIIATIINIYAEIEFITNIISILFIIVVKFLSYINKNKKYTKCNGYFIMIEKINEKIYNIDWN